MDRVKAVFLLSDHVLGRLLNIMMSDQFCRNPKVEIAPMKDETVLFNPTNNKFCLLNATAAFIWQLLEQPQTAQEITSAVAVHFANANSEQVDLDVRRALGELEGIECVVCLR